MTNFETLANLSAVTSISAPFGRDGRRYVNLANANRAYKGDSRKIYILDNTIVCESYKGFMSDGAIASLDALEAAAIALGMAVTR
jgi:hypothetical protein